MAKKKQAAAPSAPQIFAASLGANGAVIKGHGIFQGQAEAMRLAGLDVVVCGPDLAANRQLASQIEKNANGNCKRCPPHATSGSKALPHYQPDPRPPSGHTFYETPNRRAI
jgi:hypothetical protein